MSIDLENLLKLAKDASRGNWKAERGSQAGVSVGNVQIATTHLHVDAAFIAAANPGVVIELINMLKSYMPHSDATDADELHGDGISKELKCDN